jgi:hypothetical protein
MPETASIKSLALNVLARRLTPAPDVQQRPKIIVDAGHFKGTIAPCGSPHCAGCYEASLGVRIHPPKCGEDYRAWLERWEEKGKLQ